MTFWKPYPPYSHNLTFKNFLFVPVKVYHIFCTIQFPTGCHRHTRYYELKVTTMQIFPNKLSSLRSNTIPCHMSQTLKQLYTTQQVNIHVGVFILIHVCVGVFIVILLHVSIRVCMLINYSIHIPYYGRWSLTLKESSCRSTSKG